MTSNGTYLTKWTARIEGAITGLAYATSLVALGACGVAGFRPGELSKPYWPNLRTLRTDTLGAICFCLATVLIGASEYLRLLRHHHRGSGPATDPSALVVAVARAVMAAASVVVGYISLNAVTHPSTLSLHATHLLSWPSEGTLRVVALAVAAGAAAALRLEQMAPMREAP